MFERLKELKRKSESILHAMSRVSRYGMETLAREIELMNLRGYEGMEELDIIREFADDSEWMHAEVLGIYLTAVKLGYTPGPDKEKGIHPLRAIQYIEVRRKSAEENLGEKVAGYIFEELRREAWRESVREAENGSE